MFQRRFVVLAVLSDALILERNTKHCLASKYTKYQNSPWFLRNVASSSVKFVESRKIMRFKGALCWSSAVRIVCDQ